MITSAWCEELQEGYGALDSARFAVVQHLVRFRLSGHELPSYLPPLLVGSWTEKGGQAKAECKDWIQVKRDSKEPDERRSKMFCKHVCHGCQFEVANLLQNQQTAAETNMDQGLAMMLGIPEPQLRQACQFCLLSFLLCPQ